MKNTLKGTVIRILSAAVCAVAASCFMLAVASAEGGKADINGRIYELEESKEYSESDNTFANSSSDNAFGKFTVQGNITEQGVKNGAPSFLVKDSSVSFSYTYSDSLFNASEEEWHLADDGRTVINGVNLDAKAGMGAVVLQVSIDGEKWFTEQKRTNVFKDVPVENQPFYSPNEIQLLNGCYYRAIIAYETVRKTDPTKVLFVDVDNYEYKRHMEVYDFYVQLEETANNPIDRNVEKFTMGTAVNAGHDKGFSESNPIELHDVHYNWNLGNFYVSGHTDVKTDTDGQTVILKNCGDKVTLWFDLLQDIDKLNGMSNLKINNDGNGYDQKFRIPQTDFGRGTLIIRHTDYEGVKHDPVIYTNYLEALASPNANNIVQLFEEGDYEVSLDYEIMDDQIIDYFYNYSISFSFKVRNGNTMVFPIELETYSELTNTAVTDKGFRIDLANSRYLSVTVQKTRWVKGVSGYTEDVRFNSPAKEGDTYTDEGIYTIKAVNSYTGEEIEKKIYVGTDSVLIAAMNPANSGYSVNDIYALVSSGATIDSNGVIIILEKETESIETEAPETEPDTEIASDGDNGEAVEAISENIADKPVNAAPVIIICVVVVAAVIIIIIAKSKSKSDKTEGK